MSLLADEENDDTTIIEDQDRHQHQRHENNHTPHPRSLSEQRQSGNSSVKRSSSEEHTSTLPAEGDEDEAQTPSNEIKSIVTAPTTAPFNRIKPIPKIKYSIKTSLSTSTSITPKNGKSSSLKWSPALTTRKYQANPSPRLILKANHIHVINMHTNHHKSNLH